MAKILIVEDSNLARRSARNILETAGHVISEAQDGMQALEQYFLDKPELVLLDVTMREMDGIEVLKRIRELDSESRVLFVTADVQSSTREMADTGGACGFVMKPVTSTTLLQAVQDCLTPRAV